jgi:hypothetical protein
LNRRRSKVARSSIFDDLSITVDQLVCSCTFARERQPEQDGPNIGGALGAAQVVGDDLAAFAT